MQWFMNSGNRITLIQMDLTEVLEKNLRKCVSQGTYLLTHFYCWQQFVYDMLLADIYTNMTEAK